MSEAYFVGIDTSNYTTSVALCDREGRVLANIKAPMPVSEGGRGLRQSDAVFAHIKNLPAVLEQLRATLGGRRPTAVGVSATPRTAEGSYMPCFLTGVAAAEALAVGAEAPLYRFSHQDGHIMAAGYSSGALDTLLGAPFCAFHVSGGTTELVHVVPRGNALEIQLLGGTRDLNAGQAIDRAGVAMGLKFPCGPAMEAAALEYDGRVPRPKVCVHGFECNLSGLENLAAGMYHGEEDLPRTAAFVLSFVGHTLRELCRNVRAAYPGEPVLFAGGVMSNSIIKNMIGHDAGIYYSEPAFSADNAAGVALLCRRAWLAEEKQNG